jgi:hypothetical protein
LPLLLPEDDSSWMHVDDINLSPEVGTPRKVLSAWHVGNRSSRQSSYVFTGSGLLRVKGLDYGIDATGINDGTRAGSRPGFAERMVELGPLGQGSQGTVSEAIDLWDMRLVAMKRVQLHHKAKRRQLVQELLALRRCAGTCAHVVDFFDAYSTDGAIVIAMECMGGGSVQDFVDSGGTPTVSFVATCGWQSASGLAHVHALGLLHRDVKPANLLFDRDVL